MKINSHRDREDGQCRQKWNIAADTEDRLPEAAVLATLCSYAACSRIMVDFSSDFTLMPVKFT
jgi:hypothetical protein